MDVKPLFKNKFKPIYRNNDSLYIGFETQSLEITDPDNTIEKLLNECDGNNSVYEISKLINLTYEETLDIIYDLSEYGIFEKVSSYNLMNDKYKTNLNYYENFTSLEESKVDIHEKFRNTTVLVLGLGGSSTILLALAGMGIGKIIGVDFDVIDTSNLSRQFMYRKTDIGKLKTGATVEHISNYNSDTEIDVYNMEINNYKDILNLVEESDIVLNGIDTPPIESTRWVNKACIEKKKPYIQGGLTNHKIIIQTYNPLSKDGCYDCNLLNGIIDSNLFKEELLTIYNYNYTNRNISFGPNVLLLSAYITSLISKFIITNSLPTENFSVDIFTLERENMDIWKLNENCPTCKGGKEFYNLEKLISLWT